MDSKLPSASGASRLLALLKVMLSKLRFIQHLPDVILSRSLVEIKTLIIISLLAVNFHLLLLPQFMHLSLLKGFKFYIIEGEASLSERWRGSVTNQHS